MPESNLITLREPGGATAVIAPEQGGWLLRYARPVEGHGLVEALHYDPEVLERYPKQMYAGNPVLFPTVSLNHAGGKDYQYEWGGRVRAMPQHGFARLQPWRVVERADASVAIELRDDESTRPDYPFGFRHRLTCRLEQGRFHWVQEIENTGGEPMPFSTGFHPYFRVPLGLEGDRQHCVVRIPESRRMIPHGHWERFTDEPFPEQAWSVDVDVQDTLLLADPARRELVLADPRGGIEAVLNWEEAAQFRYVAIWSRSTAEPYYCLEPWTALPNCFGRPQDGEVTVLEPGGVFRAAFWMDLRRAG